MNREEQLDYELMKQKALEQLRSGKSLYGEDGAFAPLLKSFLDSALEAELESHLDKEERLSAIEEMERQPKISEHLPERYLSRHHAIEARPLSPRLSESGKLYWPRVWRTRLSACTVSG